MEGHRTADSEPFSVGNTTLKSVKMMADNHLYQMLAYSKKPTSQDVQRPLDIFFPWLPYQSCFAIASLST